MSRPNHSLSPLQARKHLLVLEAELQRGQFCSDIHVLSQTVQGVAQGFSRKATSVGSFASMAALVAGGVAAFRGRNTPDGRKPSKLSRLVSMAKWATSVWLMARSKKP